MDGTDGEAAASPHQVASDELKAFVERYERLEESKQEIAQQQKEVMDEAKSRGYVTKALRKVIAMRKRDRDDLAEEEAIIDIYRDALGV